MEYAWFCFFKKNRNEKEKKKKNVFKQSLEAFVFSKSQFPSIDIQKVLLRSNSYLS